MNKVFSFVTLISLSTIFFIFSCGEPEEIIPVVSISDDFELEGKWNFSFVNGDGVIFGVPQSSEDENPTGYVEFLPGGKGYSDFSLSLLNMPFELQDSVVWTRPAEDTIIVQAVTEGKVDVWNILFASKDSINAEWPINIAGNTATINVQFTVD
jgi:hypothetical protein